VCGRMTLTATEPLLLAEVFRLGAPPPVAPKPRYNLAPTQDVLIVAAESPRRLAAVRWGLVPSWAKDLKLGASLINARADTVAVKPSFRAAFKRRRCLVAVDGWYEWKATEAGKLPFRFRRPDGRPFAVAGIHEAWTAPDGAVVRSCAVITTEANAVAATVHDRMPVVVPAEAFDLWLTQDELSPDDARALLRPAPDPWFVVDPASTRVNSVRNDDPDVLRA
jgi:putative SOS response-associated peptidase YedK